ncbi:hypothetical protein ACFLS1_11795, partial [Verrucomicrobiota bacterium]
GPDRKEVKLVRKKKGDSLEVTELSRKKETDASKIYSVEFALSHLQLDDVADPALSDEQMGLTKPVIFRLKTYKGEIYTVKIGGSPEGAENRYVRINAELEEPKDDTETRGHRDAGKEKGDEESSDSKKDERKELEAGIKTLNDQLGKWTYLINAGKAEAMTREQKDLVKDKEKK